MTGRCDLISGRQVLGGLAALAALAASWALAGDAVSAQVEPPRRGEPIETVWFSVGDMREVDLSTAFVGSVNAYTATSDNEAAVSVSWAGSAVSLTAEGAGVAFVEVRAFNEGGSVSQWIGAVSTAAAEEDDGVVDDGVVDDGENEATPSDNGSARNGDETAVDVGAVSSPLAIALVAQAYCQGSADEMMTDEESAIFRIEPSAVARFGVTYAVIGGQPPYSVTSPEAAETASGPSGALQVACAVPDPASSDGDRLYLGGARALAIDVEVSDAAGETASATLIVQMASGRTYLDNGDGTSTESVFVPGIAQPGHTYVLATPSAWVRIRLAPSLALRFEQLDEEGIAHFADRELGWEVRLDWITGAEVGRTTGVVPETNPAILGIHVIYPSAEMGGGSDDCDHCGYS